MAWKSESAACTGLGLPSEENSLACEIRRMASKLLTRHELSAAMPIKHVTETANARSWMAHGMACV